MSLKPINPMRCSMLQEQILLPGGITVRDPNGERYVIESLLGIGRSGAVYLVRDRRTKQHVFALKEVIDPSKRDLERFIFEGEILKRLKHRALPHVYRVFEHDNLKRVYLLMDYVKGRNLETLRHEQPDQRFALPLVIALLAPIVDALIYLHQQEPPIVHRDIKPANIIVPVGTEEAVLVDFGSAKEYELDATTAAIHHGSPGYAALEQYGRGTTPRTDIYGLGATFYTLLTGIVPPDAITRATGSKGVDPLVAANLITPTVPLAAAQAIQRAMSISSEDRFATVEAFWQEMTDHALERLMHIGHGTTYSTALSLPVSAEELGSIKASIRRDQHHTPRTKKRSTLLIILLTLLLSVAVGMSFFFYFAGYGHTPSSLDRATRPSTTSIPQSTATSPTLSPVPTLTLGQTIYPSLSASYAGTIGDILAKEKTPLFLSNIQQTQGNIQGYFRGLGMVGPFKGTVTPSGHLQFKVTIFSGDATLSFDGAIKVGGDIVGSYAVLNQRGQPTGEAGIWNAQPHP